MVKNLFSDAGESKPDGLIADTSFPLQVGSATLTASQGLLLRGTLLAEEAGSYVMATDLLEGDRILTDDTLVGEEAINVEAYISGAFSTSEVICDGDIEKHRDKLRAKGIYLKTTVGGQK